MCRDPWIVGSSVRIPKITFSPLRLPPRLCVCVCLWVCVCELIRSCVYHEGARLFQQLSGLELPVPSVAHHPITIRHGIESLGGGYPAGRLWRMRPDNLPSLSSLLLILFTEILFVLVVSENVQGSNFRWNFCRLWLFSGCRLCAGTCDGQDGPLHAHRALAQQREAPGTPRTPPQGDSSVTLYMKISL